MNVCRYNVNKIPTHALPGPTYAPVPTPTTDFLSLPSLHRYNQACFFNLSVDIAHQRNFSWVQLARPPEIFDSSTESLRSRQPILFNPALNGVTEQMIAW